MFSLCTACACTMYNFDCTKKIKIQKKSRPSFRSNPFLLFIFILIIFFSSFTYLLACIRTHARKYTHTQNTLFDFCSTLSLLGGQASRRCDGVYVYANFYNKRIACTCDAGYTTNDDPIPQSPSKIKKFYIIKI